MNGDLITFEDLQHRQDIDLCGGTIEYHSYDSVR
jgi:hypothetical protein